MKLKFRCWKCVAAAIHSYTTRWPPPGRVDLISRGQQQKNSVYFAKLKPRSQSPIWLGWSRREIKGKIRRPNLQIRKMPSGGWPWPAAAAVWIEKIKIIATIKLDEVPISCFGTRKEAAVPWSPFVRGRRRSEGWVRDNLDTDNKDGHGAVICVSKAKRSNSLTFFLGAALNWSSTLECWFEEGFDLRRPGHDYWSEVGAVQCWNAGKDGALVLSKRNAGQELCHGSCYPFCGWSFLLQQLVHDGRYVKAVCMLLFYLHFFSIISIIWLHETAE